MGDKEEHSQDLEKILNDIRRNSVTLSVAHKKSYFKMKEKLKYFKIPTIILSAFNSVFSVGLQPYIEQKTISITTCLISLICGIICSIELYLSIENSMRSEYDVSKSYYLLSIEIQRFLLTDRNNRSVDSKTFLTDCYGQYCKYYETSRLLEKNVHDNLTPIETEDKVGITPTESVRLMTLSAANNNSPFNNV
jgi:hypothetical protein|tara:strand:+ start:204 stop:782 length:579 start_codon:yes stop_codon:yes gene_type:complete